LNDAELIDRIDALLPQTQCTRCGYAACRPYAEALGQGTAALNRCPPGGSAGIAALAALLHREPLPLDPACGREEKPTRAVIDAAACIGCARCLPACPVDAIVGARQFLHTVLEAECNGCELCLAACPVDCILMETRAPEEIAPTAADNRQRYQDHRQRDARLARDREALLLSRKQAARLAKPP
jgi:electron transport complex protein RnfB